MNPKQDLLTLCWSIEQSPCSDLHKAWWRELAAKVRGPSLGSIFEGHGG